MFVFVVRTLCYIVSSVACMICKRAPAKHKHPRMHTYTSMQTFTYVHTSINACGRGSTHTCIHTHLINLHNNTYIQVTTFQTRQIVADFRIFLGPRNEGLHKAVRQTGHACNPTCGCKKNLS